MTHKALKSFAVAVFSVFLLVFSLPAQANDDKSKSGEFNVGEVIFDHVLDAHEFHFFNATIPLPVLLYSPQRGFSGFMSSAFHHGEHAHDGYVILTKENIEKMGLDAEVFKPQQIIPVDAAGKYDPSVKLFDFSLTRNVVQMILALIIFTWIMLRIAKRYKKGIGVTSAPKGSQSLLEPVITFVRDEVAKPNLGHKTDKYLPYLLTVFFFILINNIFGLIPGSKLKDCIIKPG